MKTRTISYVAALLGISIIASTTISRAVSIREENKGFAVVELFTSEGCSSCPPADELISRIQKESSGKPVYILAFHVDYWNRLGWKDQFSSAAFSQRQNQYAEWMKLSSVYTPQAVVNGNREFVGADESTLRQAVGAGLNKAASSGVSLKNVKISRGRIDLEYHTSGVTAGTSLLLAVIQKVGVSKVLKGENGGRTLSHVQIVRNLQTIDLGQELNGSASLDIPGGINSDNLEVIAFIQRNNNGEIIAATKSAVI
jgi:hypothetical protein